MYSSVSLYVPVDVQQCITLLSAHSLTVTRTFNPLYLSTDFFLVCWKCAFCFQQLKEQWTEKSVTKKMGRLKGM